MKDWLKEWAGVIALGVFMTSFVVGVVKDHYKKSAEVDKRLDRIEYFLSHVGAQ